MRKIIFIAEGRLSNKNQKTNDKFISFTDIEGDERFAGEGEYYNHTEFADLIKKITPDDITFNFDYQDEFDYIIDAVDTVTAKLLIIERAVKENIPVISSMGTGNKLDITKLKVSDISKTTVCPLARVMRKELKKRGISELKVVWSDEKPASKSETGEAKGKGSAPSSAIFVPAAAGLILAGEVITAICFE